MILILKAAEVIVLFGCHNGSLTFDSWGLNSVGSLKLSFVWWTGSQWKLLTWVSLVSYFNCLDLFPATACMKWLGFKHYSLHCTTYFYYFFFTNDFLGANIFRFIFRLAQRKSQKQLFVMFPTFMSIISLIEGLSALFSFIASVQWFSTSQWQCKTFYFFISSFWIVFFISSTELKFTESND